MLTLTFRGAAPNTHVLSFSQFALRKHKGQAGRPAETILPESLDAAMAHLLSKGTSPLTRGPSDDGAHADTAGGALPPSTGGARSRSHRLGPERCESDRPGTKTDKSASRSAHSEVTGFTSGPNEECEEERSASPARTAGMEADSSDPHPHHHPDPVLAA